MATALVSRRDFIQIRDAARLLGVTEATLRNWDRAGKLQAHRHPINGYRMYRVGDLHAVLGELSRSPDGVQNNKQSENQLILPLEVRAPGPAPSLSPAMSTGSPTSEVHGEVLATHWSLAVALDPKHRPQRWWAPSSTVRKDWRKFPQEAHVLDKTETRYRRFTVEEIALLQGFNPSAVTIDGLTERELISALGDAVPPPLATAILRGIDASWNWENRTAVEICAGIGGLAEGAAAVGLEHLLLMDHSRVCGSLLRNSRPWSANAVRVGDIRSFDYTPLRGRVGLLSGGPPCQPWSLSGHRLGQADERDLLGELPDIVARVLPEVFLFENVPGLTTTVNLPYLTDLVWRLRAPARDVSYGTLVAVLNAADLGVPQIRKRVFILGFRDRPASEVSGCFDLVEQQSSHRNPSLGRNGRAPWKTVGDVLAGRTDPGGWRKWFA